jgi:FkbM family methyltransferase
MKRKIFIDCGANLGQGFCEFVKMGKISDNTEVYSFEPNPYCDISEFTLKRAAKELGCNPKIKFYRSAILHEDGVCLIVVSYDPKRYDGEGVSVHGVGNVNTDNNLAMNGLSIPVRATRLVSFIEDLEISEEDELRIKIDIEGSEFYVLKDMIKTFSKWSCLKEIWVEWHERYMRGFDPEKERSEIEQSFEKMGVTIQTWI